MHYRRIYIPGGSYFITATLANRNSNLLIDKIINLKNAFKKVKLKYNFYINAIVILPNHFHMLIKLPENDADYSKRIRLIKSYFSKSIERNETISESRKLKAEREIWQRRFWEHTIRDEKDFEFHMNYIHYNPVKHRLVLNPIDWKYSSIHKYVKSGVIKSNWSATI